MNFVNAPAIAEERGIRVSELKESESRDYANLVSVATVADGQRIEVAGTTIGPRHRPHLVSAYGQSFNIELMKHLAVFRYSDVPGMIGKIGTVLGEHGINVASTAVGREPDHEPDSPAGGGSGRYAVMVVTVDSPVPDEVIQRDRLVRGLPGRPRGHAVGGARPGDRAGSVLCLEDRRDAAAAGHEVTIRLRRRRLRAADAA